jgi:hypothetical protein
MSFGFILDFLNALLNVFFYFSMSMTPPTTTIFCPSGVKDVAERYSCRPTISHLFLVINLVEGEMKSNM